MASRHCNGAAIAPWFCRGIAITVSQDPPLAQCGRKRKTIFGNVEHVSKPDKVSVTL